MLQVRFVGKRAFYIFQKNLNKNKPPAPKRVPKKYTAPEDLAAAGSTQPMTQLTQPTPVPVSKGSFSSEVTLVVDNREISGKGRGKTELKKLLGKQIFQLGKLHFFFREDSTL